MSLRNLNCNLALSLPCKLLQSVTMTVCLSCNNNYAFIQYSFSSKYHLRKITKIYPDWSLGSWQEEPKPMGFLISLNQRSFPLWLELFSGFMLTIEIYFSLNNGEIINLFGGSKWRSHDQVSSFFIPEEFLPLAFWEWVGEKELASDT